ncbi:ATP-dependent metallopeptidase FtsH/Yme1/Tma family protein, partial [Vibrio parahaemolyticus]|nr:ATP-dependent metallopeptidase FtsH/Yme1/Tma family protein [Vibrio parahaemolyticus]
MKRIFRGISIYLIIVLLIMLSARMLGTNVERPIELSFTELVANLNDGSITRITSIGNTVEGELANGNKFTSILPEETRVTFYHDYVKDLVDSGEIIYDAEQIPTTPWYIELLPTIFILLIFGVFWMVMMQQSQGGGNKGVMSFGRS